MKLTKANVDRLKLPSSKKEIIVFDETLPGFGLHIRGGGKRSWVAQYRLGSKQRRVTLGTVETLDPDKARQRAKSAFSKVHPGRRSAARESTRQGAGGGDLSYSPVCAEN
jgi:hypothetical protein